MQTYLISLFAIGLTLGVIKSLQKVEWLGEETGRKLLHLVAVLVCGYVIQFDEHPLALSFIFLIATGILAYIAHKNVLLPSARRSFGIALFPLAFAVLLWSPMSKEAILFGVLTLAISDALAGVTGVHWAKQKIVFLHETKSWLGFGVFYFTTLFIGYFFIGFEAALIILALVPALSELFSYKGSDNLTVPIVAAVWFELLKNKSITSFEVILLILIVIILYVLNRKKLLTLQGTIAAILLAISIVIGVGSIYLIPIGVFFVVGSLSSKLAAKSKENEGRSAIQVFANGGVATLSLVLYGLTGNPLFELGYLMSLCVSLSDTMSSDLGTYFGQPTYDIISRKPMKIGLSGGVSWAGSLAGIIAAIAFGFGMYFVLSIDENWIFWIIISGVFGMFLDSVLGSAFQAKYSDEKELHEDHNLAHKLVKGYAWMTNNAVNFTTNILTTLLFLAVMLVIS